MDTKSKTAIATWWKYRKTCATNKNDEMRTHRISTHVTSCKHNKDLDLNLNILLSGTLCGSNVFKNWADPNQVKKYEYLTYLFISIFNHSCKTNQKNNNNNNATAILLNVYNKYDERKKQNKRNENTDWSISMEENSLVFLAIQSEKWNLSKIHIFVSTKWNEKQNRIIFLFCVIHLKPFGA